MLATLSRQIDERGIVVIEDHYVSELLVADGTCFGALAFDLHSGERVALVASAVVLCGGGHTRLWRRSSSRRDENFGEGIHLALDAGCALKDMELVQFHPTGMVAPEEVAGTLVTEAVRGEGGRLFNALGERFMEQYDPQRLELSTRDRVALANYTEIAEGRGTPSGGVFLDITHLGKDKILERLPRMHRQFIEYQMLDISRVADGGGAHGALHDGRRRGGSRHARHRRWPGSSRRASAPPGSTGPTDWAATRSSRRSCTAATRATRRWLSRSRATSRSGPGRSSAPPPTGSTRWSGRGRSWPASSSGRCATSCGSAAGSCGTKRASTTACAGSRRSATPSTTSTCASAPRAGPTSRTRCDVRAGVALSEASLIGAKARRETRGCHNRADHPALDPAFDVNHHVELDGDGRLTQWAEPVPPTPADLQPWLDEAVTFDWSDRLVE